MTLKNQMWVSYNNQPHFIEHIRTHNVLIRNLKEDTSFVSIAELSPIELPQFTKGETVLYYRYISQKSNWKNGYSS